MHCVIIIKKYNIKNLSLINNQLAIVKTLTALIAIKSGKRYVNYLIHTLSTD